METILYRDETAVFPNWRTFDTEPTTWSGAHSGTSIKTNLSDYAVHWHWHSDTPKIDSF